MTRLKPVVKVSIVQAVLVSRARLAEVRQLIHLVRPHQSVVAYAVDGRVTRPQSEPDRTSDLDTDRFHGPPGAAVAQDGHVVGRRANQQPRLSHGHVTDRVHQVPFEGVLVISGVDHHDVVGKERRLAVNEQCSPQQSGRVVLERTVVQTHPSALDSNGSALTDQCYDALVSIAVHPNLNGIARATIIYQAMF